MKRILILLSALATFLGPAASSLVTIPLEVFAESTQTSCQEMFSDEITFSYECVDSKETMSYVLYTPSSAKQTSETPMIVWLHGLGERDVDRYTFLNNGLPKTLNNWHLKGFNSYVLCPQLKYGLWNTPQMKDSLQALIDEIVLEYNIDTDNIVLVGHSSGGQGALYMAHELPGYFSKLVVLSGAYPNIDASEITIPTIGYVGRVENGEYEHISQYMHVNFLPVFGRENLFYVPTWHSNVPDMVFNEDKDGDGCSDVIQWMFN